MSVIVPYCGDVFISLFEGCKVNFVREGIIIGFIWSVINIALDLFMLMPASPMRMSFTVKRAGMCTKYVIMPTVMIGFGYVCKNEAH